MDIVLDTCPAPECNLTPRDVAGLLDQLAAYHAHFVPVFARSEQAGWAETYLHGLLSRCERKSIEPMALHLGVPIRPLQHFIGQSTWSIEPIVAQHQLLVGATLGEEDGTFLIDESGVVKQGHDSVGVAPQYCGSVGKIANAQLGVYLGYASRQGYTLLAGQLFCPSCGLARRMPPNARRPKCRRRSRFKQSLRLRSHCCDRRWRTAVCQLAGWPPMHCTATARPFGMVWPRSRCTTLRPFRAIRWFGDGRWR